MDVLSGGEKQRIAVWSEITAQNNCCSACIAHKLSYYDCSYLGSKASA